MALKKQDWRMLLILPAIVVGLAIGFGIDIMTFENPPQQIKFVRNLCIFLATIGFLYFLIWKRQIAKSNQP